MFMLFLLGLAYAHKLRLRQIRQRLVQCQEELIRCKEPANALFDKLVTFFGVLPRGVLHVGAHNAYESDLYQIYNVPKIIWFEADPAREGDIRKKAAKYKKNNPNSEIDVVMCAVSDVSGRISFYRTNNDLSSSTLRLKKHKEISTSVVEVGEIEVPAETIDNLVLKKKDYNILVLDIQGAELKALKGAVDLLSHLDAIITEVNYDEIYENCCLIWELDAYLSDFGFIRFDTFSNTKGWGDALYLKTASVFPS